MREIADRVAVLMVYMADFSGLVAGKVLQGEEDPIADHHQLQRPTRRCAARGGSCSAPKSSKIMWIEAVPLRREAHCLT